MKNLVLMVCAVIVLFAFSSCEKCLNCIKANAECNFCDYGGNGTSSVICSDEANYNQKKIECASASGTWKIALAATNDEQKVCGNSTSEAEDKAKGFELTGYTCK